MVSEFGPPPFPSLTIDSIWAMMTVWRIRGKIMLLMLYYSCAHSLCWVLTVNCLRLGLLLPPFPQTDIIRAMVIVWRAKGKIVSSVLCNIVCNNCTQCNAHTHEQTNSSLDWVLYHWAHFTVLRFIFVYVCILSITVYCMCSIVTWWDGPGGIEAWFLGPLLRSVLWHCWLGRLTHKNPSPIWPIVCLMGH